MTYFGTTINDSPVIAGESAAALTDKSFYAVKFDSYGKIAICSVEGENVLGILPAEEGNKAIGDSIAVQIKDIGLMVASGAIAAGAEVMTDANGKAKTATAGKFIIGYALKAATAAGEVIPVQISKGMKPSNASPTVSMSDIADVDLTDIANGKILKYNGTSSKWECAADATE